MGELEKRMESLSIDKIRKSKGATLIIVISLLFILFGFILEGKSYLYAYYPYILLLLGMWALTSVKSVKLGILIFLFVLTALFPIQLFYYSIVPLHENYIPITIPYMQQIFQMYGKFHIVYYPDYPQEGETINAYIDICDNDIKNCTKLSNYTINAYFRDEADVKHVLINSTEITDSFSFPYYGRPIYISFLNNNTPMFSEFAVPRPSFYQTVAEVVPRHPIFLLLGVISSILGLLAIVEFFKNLKEVFINKVLKKINH